jgi:hypothetical protein
LSALTSLTPAASQIFLSEKKEKEKDKNPPQD